MPVAAPARGAHGDEDGAGAGNRAREILGEGEAAGLRIGCHDLIQPRFENRDFSPVEVRDLGPILVDADDVVTEFRQASRGNEPDISCSDHGDTHGNSLDDPAV
jgi:hypothetical protein